MTALTEFLLTALTILVASTVAAGCAWSFCALMGWLAR